MSNRLDRRTFLAGALAGGVVIAFDPTGRSWVTAAQASEGPVPGAIAIPKLDGELVTDPAALAEAADDYGHIVHRTPVAVLRPGSARDVARMVRYANRHDIAVAIRGQGHATFGQAQTGAGVVIDSRSLAAIHRISAYAADVDAGVRWIDLAQTALARGLTAPVFTDYVELSVGGTLSVGGLGGTSQHFGLQVDNVLALEVVTGRGQLRRCSPTEHPLLFNAVLGGLGQFAIIVRATVRLRPAPAAARSYQLSYSDLGSYLRDQRRALGDGRFSSLQGQAVPKDGGGWEYLLDAAVYYTGADRPDDAAVLAGLTPDSGRVLIQDLSYVDWVNRLAPTVEFLKQIGAWFLPHPWVNLFVPDSRIESFARTALADLTVADTGQGPVLLYPFWTERVTRPFVRVPEERVAFLFAILRTAVPPEPAVVARQLQDNRLLYERARDVGGMRYPVGSVPFTPADWRDQLGSDYPAFAAAKLAFDPRRVLTPGQGIFAPPA